MTITTKFNIGEVVWLVFKDDDWVEVNSDIITDITISEEKDRYVINYFLKNLENEIEEEKLIAINDKEKLLETIKQMDSELKGDK